MKKTSILMLTIAIALMLFQALPSKSLACGGKISGTVSYSGELTGPIVVMAVRVPPSPDALFYATILQSAGGYEICDLPDGIYIVSAFMDIDGSEGPNPGEPVGLLMDFVIIENGSEFCDANMNLLELPAGMGSISGKIDYFGNKTGPVKVVAIGLSYTPINYTMVDLAVDNSYTIDNLMTGSYILIAYLDANRDGLPWLTEPIGTITELIPVMDGQNTPDQDIILIDPESHTGSISGTISYQGSRTGIVYVTAMGITYTPISATGLAPGDSIYLVPKLAQGEYGVMAYMDVNGDRHPNATEPMGYFEDGFIKVKEGVETPDINIMLSDPPEGQGVVKGTITCDLGGLAKGSACHNIVVQAMGLSKTPLVAAKLSEYGEYELTGLSTGLYFMIAYEDLNNDAFYTLGEPIGLFQGNPFLLIEQWPKEDVDIAIQDPMKAKGSLSGTITYDGDRSGDIHVLAIGFSHTPFESAIINQAGPYQVTDLGLGVYYIMAYMDADSDGKFDIGEPLAFYTSIATVVGGFETQNVDITLYDKGTGAICGNVIYSGDLAGKIYVGAFGLSNTPISKISMDLPGPYKLDNLCKGRFVAWAFMDIDGDKLPGLHEPFTITGEVIHVEDSLETTDIDLVLDTFYPMDVENSNPFVAAPQEFELMQNFPNPFNSSTIIQYRLPDAAKVTLRIFNMLGEEIHSVVLDEQTSGVHQLAWDSKDSHGKQVASGFYIYQIESANFIATKKLLLVR